MADNEVPLASRVPAKEELWRKIQDECSRDEEPLLPRFLHNHVIYYGDFTAALAGCVGRILANEWIEAPLLEAAAREAFSEDPGIVNAAAADLHAVIERDPASDGSYLDPFLFYKGFHAIESQRVANWLWKHKRKRLALYIQSIISRRLQIDIHPNVEIGGGLFIDHAANIVVGETAKIGRRVSILQNVTLGGTGIERGDRHPIVEDDVLISPGAKVIGRVTLGRGCHIGPGSVVVLDVEPFTVVSGPLAQPVIRHLDTEPELTMDHLDIIGDKR